MSNGQMRLYTSTGTRKTIEKCNANNIGLLMVDHWRNPDDWPFFAVDNGCFASYHRQEVWNPAPFMNILSKCKERGYIPDFIVIPDKVADKGSLAFSEKWIPILSELYPRFPKYLAVQDGMTEERIKLTLEEFPEIKGLFVGGTMDWKMDTLKLWIDLAHQYGIQCHVGRIGPIRRMMICELAGADSIDSTTWTQNKGGIERYIGGYKAQTMIEEHGVVE